MRIRLINALKFVRISVLLLILNRTDAKKSLKDFEFGILNEKISLNQKKVIDLEKLKT